MKSPVSHIASSVWLKTELENTWQLSDRSAGRLELPQESAASMQLKAERELTEEELGDILRLNCCTTLDELIDRLSNPKYL